MLGLSGVFVAREVRRAHPILWEFREREGETECVCMCMCVYVLVCSRIIFSGVHYGNTMA